MAAARQSALHALYLSLVQLAALGGVVPDPEPALRPLRWQRFATGVIKPQGWLERQARQQAEGVTSHLPLFWPEVANTSWLGGPGDNVGGLHESTPYWLNGAVPLAYQLEDEQLLALVQHYIDGILDRQAADGWLGPDTNPSDFWSRYPVVLALVQHHEANPSDRDRVLRAVLAFFKCVQKRLDNGVAFEHWSAARAHDLIWALHYFADVVSEADATPLLRLAQQLHTVGFDWHGGWFGNASAFPRGPVAASSTTMWTHGVNNAQAVKHGAVWARQSANASASVEQSRLAWRMLMEYHGQPSGVFAADEHLAGTMPSRGSELCMVVESMWSLTLTAQASLSDSGAVEALDALEQLAVNALPGGVSDDLWSHPYLQFANSFQARPRVGDHVWATDGPDAGMYGLAPNYECCTANMHQGYAKLISHLFFQEGDDTLVSTLWLPSRLQTELASVELRTDYPFGLSAEYLIVNPKAMKLKVRLPPFLREAAGPSAGLATVRVWVEGHEQVVELKDGFLEYDIPAWPLPEPRVAVRLTWAAGLFAQRLKPDQGMSLFAGPLLLTPDLAESHRVVRRYAFESADWDIEANHSWGYALPADASGGFGAVQRAAPGRLPYGRGPEACPLRASAMLLQLEPSSWQAAHSAPGPVPQATAVHGDLKNATLLPYGCTSVHISALPEAAGLMVFM